MFGVSMWEILVVLALLAVLVGPDKLPGLARSLGKALGKVRRSVDDIKQQTGLDEDMDFLEDLRDVGRQVSDGMTLDAKEDEPPTERPAPRKTRKRKGRQRVSGPRKASGAKTRGTPARADRAGKAAGETHENAVRDRGEDDQGD